MHFVFKQKHAADKTADVSRFNRGEDDFIGYKNNNEWLKDHPGSAVIFDSPEKVWQHIVDAYRGTFKQMVYGELPSESDLLDTLSKIEPGISN